MVSVIVTWHITGFDQPQTGANINFVSLSTRWLINGISSRTGSTELSSASARSDAMLRQIFASPSCLGAGIDQ